ncbi:ELWxxDGT repeat protein [Pyxidicoccus sp. 3LG]
MEPRTAREALNLGTPEVRDINTRPARFPSLESAAVSLSASVTLFAAGDELRGRELWRSDGTEAGTSLVKDLAPGLASSTPRFLTQAQGVVFFAAFGEEGWGNIGAESLWKTDGTASGTVQVKRLPRLRNSDQVSAMTQAGGTVFFIYEQEDEQQLWKSDGTESGTVFVQSLGPVVDIYRLLAVGNTLFFTARDATYTPELWKLDAGGSVRLATFTLAQGYEDAPEFLTWLGSTLYLAVGETLWKSDGTPSGTVVVSTQSSRISSLVALNGTLFFASGGALWRSDGTTVTLVRGFSWELKGLTVHGTALYFSATEPASGSELWTSNGTVATTRLVKELVSGAAGSEPRELFSWNGGLYFTASTFAGTRGLWRTDGTAAGTVALKSWAETEMPGFEKPHLLTPVGSALFFTVPESPEDHFPRLTWRTAGTAKTTRELTGLWTGTRSSQARTQPLAVVGDSVYFVATDGTPGESLWRSDGTAAGSFLLRTFARLGDEAPTDAWTGAVGVGGTLFFRADDGVHGVELWRSDGTAFGTALVRDVNPGPDGSYIGAFAELDGTLFFTAYDAVNGWSLWRSDGTELGTVPVTAAGSSVDVRDLTVMGGSLYFTTFSDVQTAGLWKSDGTPGGTSLVTVPLGSAYSVPHQLTAVNGALYFGIVDGDDMMQLWKSNGTASGTLLVKAGFESVRAFHPEASQDALYFIADDGLHGEELWRSDGTAAGTVLVKDIQPGPESGAPLSVITRVGGQLVFAAKDALHGLELWRTDGTEAGTGLLVDLMPGPANGSSATEGDFVQLLGVEDRGLVLFSGVDAAGGAELWQTDGTVAGTFRRIDVVPGPSSSDPNSLARVGDRLFFMAGDTANGREPRFAAFPADLGSALGTSVVQGSTCASLRQVTPTCTNNGLAPDASFSWTAPVSGTFVLTTEGSSYDTSLEVSDPVSGSSLACNDDTDDTLQSSVSVSVSAGQTLLITVDGYDTECGAFLLSILPSP